jgi:hypothetical protein
VHAVQATALENAYKGSSKILLEEQITISILEMARIKVSSVSFRIQNFNAPKKNS